jgi:hypothetical protein
MAELSDYVRTLPGSFAASYVAYLEPQGEKSSAATSAAPAKDEERKGSTTITRMVLRKISAVFVGQR